MNDLSMTSGGGRESAPLALVLFGTGQYAASCGVLKSSTEAAADTGAARPNIFNSQS